MSPTTLPNGLIMHLQWLSDLRVLDLSQYLPGPFATRLLADMGADVVKVEPPGGEPGRHFDLEGKPGVSPFWRVLNSGKTVVILDLKSDQGRRALSALIERADVLLESYRPGVLDRLGFGNEALRQLNPGLVHCALSGYGQTGPARHASGHDINYQAITGGLNQCGTPGRPVIPFPPMADYAGALQAVLTVLGALLGRGRTRERLLHRRQHGGVAAAVERHLVQRADAPRRGAAERRRRLLPDLRDRRWPVCHAEPSGARSSGTTSATPSVARSGSRAATSRCRRRR